MDRAGSRIGRGTRTIGKIQTSSGRGKYKWRGGGFLRDGLLVVGRDGVVERVP
jgi:hypothetical protein